MAAPGQDGAREEQGSLLPGAGLVHRLQCGWNVGQYSMEIYQNIMVVSKRQGFIEGLVGGQ